jgi:hypothetical protein
MRLHIEETVTTVAEILLAFVWFCIAIAVLYGFWGLIQETIEIARLHKAIY